MLFTRNINLFIGELSTSDDARAQRIASALDASGVRSAAVPDIAVHEWAKFAGWVGFMALAITTRVNTWKYLSDPDASLLLVRLVREVGTLAQACGVRLTDQSMIPVATICGGSEREAANLLVALAGEFRLNSPDHKLSTLQDLEAGRPLEVEETLGFAVGKAAELGLTLPLLENFYRLAGAIDRTRSKNLNPAPSQRIEESQQLCCSPADSASKRCVTASACAVCRCDRLLLRERQPVVHQSIARAQRPERRGANLVRASPRIRARQHRNTVARSDVMQQKIAVRME